MIFNKQFFRAMGLLLAAILFSGCSKPTTPSTGLSASNSDTALFLQSLAMNDSNSLVDNLMSNPDTVSQAVSDLSAIQWQPRDQQSPSDLQTIESDGIKLQVGHDFVKMIRSLGQQFSSNQIDQQTYLDSMAIVDALLSGVIQSHQQIDDASVNTSSSALSYACLARAGASQELVKHGLGEYAPLSSSQAKLLQDVSRSREFKLLDNLP